MDACFTDELAWIMCRCMVRLMPDFDMDYTSKCHTDWYAHRQGCLQCRRHIHVASSVCLGRIEEVVAIGNEADLESNTALGHLRNTMDEEIMDVDTGSSHRCRCRCRES